MITITCEVEQTSWQTQTGKRLVEFVQLFCFLLEPGQLAQHMLWNAFHLSKLHIRQMQQKLIGFLRTH